MVRNTDVIEVNDVECIQETSKAIRVRFDDGQEYWVPKSVVDDDSEVFQYGGTGTLVIQEWWAEKEGIEG